MDSSLQIDRKKNLVGIGYALLAYIAWGVLPLYWKLLGSISAGEILAHRILWSFVFVAGILVIYGKWEEFKKTTSIRRNRLAMYACSILISANWFTYIFAVNTDRLVEASFGYYISPLFSVLLAILILKERLNVWQGVALFFAAIGGVIITSQFGSIPWIAIILATSFAVYGLVKKMGNYDSLTGLAVETAFVMPIAFLYISFLQMGNNGSFEFSSNMTTLLLIGSGIATAMPLLWFAQAASRTSLSNIGFLQYLGPSISLAIGVYLFHEPFTKYHMISFAFIWLALVFYSTAKTKKMLWIQDRIVQLIKKQPTKETLSTEYHQGQ